MPRMARRLSATFLAIAIGLALAAHSGLVRAAGDSKGVVHRGRVFGSNIARVELAPPGSRAFREIAWRDLSHTALAVGDARLRFRIVGGPGVVLEVPACAGRRAVRVDGRTVAADKGPVLVPLPARPSGARVVEIDLHVSAYHKRIVCGFEPRFGRKLSGRGDEFVELRFPSEHGDKGGGKAIAYLPKRRRGESAKRPLLVGTHPWNGDMWTYAAVEPLLAAASARGVILLFPSGLGNSLYTAPAEEEVMRAIEAATARLDVDSERVSIWGASMGGAGATTIGFHHPDRFASVTSLFGDSKYDLSTYVRSILKDEAGAHVVNALDVVDNARHLDVWLVHGDQDTVSPERQSRMLAQALKSRAFSVNYTVESNTGHDGALVSKHAKAIVDRADTLRRIAHPARVSYRSVRPQDRGAYGVALTRTGTGDAFVDVERRGDRIHVLAAENVASVDIDPRAFGEEPSRGFELEIPKPLRRLPIRLVSHPSGHR